MNKLITLFLVLIITNSISWAKQDERCNVPAFYGFCDVYKIIKRDYVSVVDDAKLNEAAINGMLASLDPHSGFLNKDMYGELNSYSKGEFGGVGIEVIVESGLIQIIAPLDDSPAAKAGIKAGDYIIGIDGQSIYGSNTSDDIKRIRGEPGSIIKLTILRNNHPTPFDIIMKRENIKIISVKSRVESKDVAYIRVSSFSENVAKNIIKGLNNLTEKNSNIKGIVLDLRNNPGGLLEQAVDVADIFLQTGTIVSTKGRDVSNNIVYAANKKGHKCIDLPLVILINEGSASASEIVAGALQDHKRAIIIGSRSFGKGSVQTVIPLNGGSAVGLTTALYYTPNGRSIQAEGIIPDIVVEQSIIKETNNAQNTREENLLGHINQSGVIKSINNETLQFDKFKTSVSLNKEIEEDYQLERAVDLIKGISIYKKEVVHE